MTLESVPAPVRRVAAFTLVAFVVYAVLLGAGLLIFPGSWGTGGYRLSVTIAAAGAALYLVYLGGLEKLRDVLR